MTGDCSVTFFSEVLPLPVLKPLEMLERVISSLFVDVPLKTRNMMPVEIMR